MRKLRILDFIFGWVVAQTITAGLYRYEKIDSLFLVYSPSIIFFVVGILATLSADKASLLGDVTFMGRGFFDWFDYLSSNILMPLGGLLIVIFMSYVVDRKSIKEELTNNGSLNLNRILPFFFIVIRYVTPALLIIIFLNAVGVIKL